MNIALVGTYENKDEIYKLYLGLSLEDNIVLPPVLIADAEKHFSVTALDKTRIEATQLHKIDISTEVYVVAKDGILTSYMYELIGYALTKRKKVILYDTAYVTEVLEVS